MKKFSPISIIRRIFFQSLCFLKDLFRNNIVFIIGISIFILSVLFINPLRETAFQDDWGYALTVQKLLSTGKYQQNNWIAPNPYFQIYWGYLFCIIFGFSTSILRISTLVIVLIGSLAFYDLLKEHEIRNNEAGLLVFSLLCSPLVFKFSFSYMTDVPFLMLMIMSVYLYTKAIRTNSYLDMIIASILASATILTRQFGVALVFCIGLSWLISKKSKKQTLLYFIGIGLPIVATLWQAFAGFNQPSWGYQKDTLAQSLYFMNGHVFFANILWRPAIILEYLVFFTLPFLVVYVFITLRNLFKNKNSGQSHSSIKIQLLILGGVLIYLVSAFLAEAFSFTNGILMPYLPWNFAILAAYPKIDILLSISMFVGAIFLGQIIIMRYINMKLRIHPFSPHLLIFDFVTLFLLFVTLIYQKIGDEYLICLVPYTIMVIGYSIKGIHFRYQLLIGILCLGLLIPTSLWTRSDLSISEAYWKGGDYLLDQGIPESEIDSGFYWNNFHNNFELYLQSIDYKVAPDLNDYFYRWIPEYSNRAKYSVSASLTDGELLKTIPYEDFLLRKQLLYVIKK